MIYNLIKLPAFRGGSGFASSRLKATWLSRNFRLLWLIWLGAAAVLAQPTITDPPSNVTVIQGKTATFSAGFSAVAGRTLEWRFNGTALSDGNNISGATANTLTLTQVTSSQAGQYTITVTDSTGTVTSQPATLTVLPPLVIGSQPQSIVILPGGKANFAVNATGSGTLRYQWRQDGASWSDSARISGATSSSITVLNADQQFAGVWTVRINDSADQLISQGANLTFVSQLPQPQASLVGSNAVFRVLTVGPAPTSFQWTLNGSAISDGPGISGATTATLTLTDLKANQAGDYSVAIANGGAATTTPAVKLGVFTAETSFTVMIYGHADHNLSQSLITDMLEMQLAGSSPGFNIVVQADFDAAKPNTGLPDELKSGVTRFLMTSGKNNGTLTSTVLERLPESVNMDNPDALKDFVTWALKNYPAGRYGLVLWDHGGQYVGFGGDSQDGTLKSKGILNTLQIRTAVTSAMETANLRKWDFIAFDTCLMGAAECLPDFAPLTDVYLACPEIDYGAGWEYTATLGFLKSNPGVTPLDFGRQEAKDWRAHHLAPGKTSDLTLASHAVYDLTKYPDFLSKFNAFGTLLTAAAVPGNMAIPTLRRSTTQYSISKVEELGKPTDFVDLGEFALAIANEATLSSELRAAANSLVAAIDTLVVEKVLGTKKANTRGLSIYYPDAGSADNSRYLALTLSLDPQSTWKQYLAKVAANRAADTVAPVVGAGAAAAGGTGAASSSGTLITSRNARLFASPSGSFNLEVTSGDDAFELTGNIFDNHFTGDTNNFVSFGEVLNERIHGVGTYSIHWDSTLPYLSSPVSGATVLLGGDYSEANSDLMISFAQYRPPYAPESPQLVILLTKINPDDTAEVIDVLDASDEEEGLAPSALELEPGGTLTPNYYLEKRVGDSPQNWIGDSIDAHTAIQIPTNGIAGLIVAFRPVPPGVYRFEAQVGDLYDNVSEPVAFEVNVAAVPETVRLTIQPLPNGMLSLTWPSSAAAKLQVTPGLDVPTWVNVPEGSISTVGGDRVYTSADTTGNQFYRLRK